MKKSLKVCLILFAFVLSANAQNEDKTCRLITVQSIQLDEIGEVPEPELKDRIGRILEKQKEIPNAQIYIINNGLADEIKKREKQIVELFKFDYRVTYVRCENCEAFSTELWLVPAGADPPPFSDRHQTDKGTVLRNPYKFEEIGQVSDRFLKWIMGEFVGKIRDDESLTGYILIEGSEGDISAAESKILNQEAVQKINSGKIVFIRNYNGNSLKMELWIVPRGAELPPPLVVK
ncbi:MAG: hypothetical protein LUM44_14840 [Pyrinomonadaceae bacterium]|nr:hypothetical protein [Pyrinomonadaceae bacterium]